LEVLEDRTCPSVSAAVYFGNTLVIVGDAGNDAVTVTDDGAGGISGTILGSTNTASASGTGIKNVLINTKGGDDSVNFTLNGPLTSRLNLAIDLGAWQDTSTNKNSVTLNLNQPISAPYLNVGILGTAGQDTVSVSLGSITNSYVAIYAALLGNDDNFSATVNGDINGYSALAMAVFGGSGNDSISASINGNVSANSAVGVFLDGGYGDDAVSFTYSGQLNGHLGAALLGGPGNDTVSANITADSGSTGHVAAYVAGGDGDDTLTLNINDNSGGTLDVGFALIDGGPGTNTCTKTSNVTAINC
jgi:hypothetical protein